MAQLIQAHNDSHIVSPGHAPNAPLIQASAPPPQQFRVTGDDPNARPDDRSVWNPQTNQWERGTAAIANQNARLADERRGQMAFEADMRRSLNTPIDVGALGGVGGGRMPTQGEVDAMLGNVRRGAERARASMGLPSSVLPSANGKKGSVTFTGGGNPAEAATVDPMARWIEASAFLRDADGNIKEGWGDQAKWLEDQMRAEWGRRYGFENGASVAKEITGAQGTRGNTPRLDEYLQSVGATPQGGETGTTAPATTEAGAPAAAPARKGKFRIAKADGSYVIEGEGDTFTETKNGETTTGRLDDLPVGSVQITDGAPAKTINAASPEAGAVETGNGAAGTPKNGEAGAAKVTGPDAKLSVPERVQAYRERQDAATKQRAEIRKKQDNLARLRRRGKNDEADRLEEQIALEEERLRSTQNSFDENLIARYDNQEKILVGDLEEAQRGVDSINQSTSPYEAAQMRKHLEEAKMNLEKFKKGEWDFDSMPELESNTPAASGSMTLDALLNPTPTKTPAKAPAAEAKVRPLTEAEKREQEELDKMLMGE